MKKVYEQLLATFKKSNKEGKLRLAKKFNYKTSEEFLKFLETELGTKNKTVATKGNTKKSNTVKKSPKKAAKAEVVAEKPTIHNVHILDASGSMNSQNKIGIACAGINEEIKALKEDKTVNYTHTFVHFSGRDDYKVEQLMVPISLAKPVNMRGRDMTALNDAIGKTLQTLDVNVTNNEKVLVKVFTDGGENDSRSWNSNSVKELISKLEGKGFTVAFVGTEQEVLFAVKKYGIDKTNTLVHNNTAKGVMDSFERSIGSTMLFASDLKKGKDVSKGFYTKKIGKL